MITTISPSTTPTVVVYSFPICMVILPVALVVTVILTAATSPTVMFSTVTFTEDASLSTLNVVVPFDSLYFSSPMYFTSTLCTPDVRLSNFNVAY